MALSFEVDDATVVVVPRDRWSVAVESLRSVLEHTAPTVPVRYVVTTDMPAAVADEVRRLLAAGDRGEVLEVQGPLSPNEARNVGLAAVTTPLVAFVDNDVVVEPGWLPAMVVCAAETDAGAVTPLICHGWPPATEIHSAGGRILDGDGRAGGSSRGGGDGRRLADAMDGHGVDVAEAGPLERRPTDLVEFHAVLFDVDALRSLGGFDEALLATREHLDITLALQAAGHAVYFEPAAVVTYLYPSERHPVRLGDVPYFLLRWSDEWIVASLDHFADKWDLADDAELDRRRGDTSWRRDRAVWRPMLGRVPMVGRRGRVVDAAMVALRPLDRFATGRLVRRHETRTRRARPADR